MGFDVDSEKSPERIQNIVDSSPEADFYCTDGYIDVIYSGKHIKNAHDKSNTFTVGGILTCGTIFPFLDGEAVVFYAALILLKQYFCFLYC